MTPYERAERVARMVEPENLSLEIQVAIQQALHELLEKVGQRGTCRGCGTEIFWVRHKTSGKLVPYSCRSSLNHFIDCPRAAEFRKDPRAERMGAS